MCPAITMARVKMVSMDTRANVVQAMTEKTVKQVGAIAYPILAAHEIKPIIHMDPLLLLQSHQQDIGLIEGNVGIELK